MKLAPRWRVILHAIRIFSEHLYDGMVISMDGRELMLTNVDKYDCDLDVIDAVTGEMIVSYTEDGTPILEFSGSDWATEPMDYDVPNVYPMYDCKS